MILPCGSVFQLELLTGWHHAILNVWHFSLDILHITVSQICCWSWGFLVSVLYCKMSFTNRLLTCENVLVQHVVRFNLWYYGIFISCVSAFLSLFGVFFCVCLWTSVSDTNEWMNEWMNEWANERTKNFSADVKPFVFLILHKHGDVNHFDNVRCTICLANLVENVEIGLLHFRFSWPTCSALILERKEKYVNKLACCHSLLW